jgi:hypothetical protein
MENLCSWKGIHSPAVQKILYLANRILWLKCGNNCEHANRLCNTKHVCWQNDVIRRNVAISEILVFVVFVHIVTLRIMIRYFWRIKKQSTKRAVPNLTGRGASRE